MYIFSIFLLLLVLVLVSIVAIICFADVVAHGDGLLGLGLAMTIITVIVLTFLAVMFLVW